MAEARAKSRRQKLKVFRTPIGFHDAYVAASSQKAALEAWGAGTNLFTAGTAELVTDPKLTKEPLAKPGEVVRRVRGSAEDHLRALGSRAGKKDKPQRRKAKPSRSDLDRAERALATVERRHAEERDAFDREEQALKRRRRALEDRQRKALERAAEKRDAADERYRRAISAWTG